MSKGISPIMEVTMLLLILMSVLGSAFIFFINIEATVEDSGTSVIGTDVSHTSEDFRIEHRAGDKIYIRNMGNEDLTGLSFYVDDSIVDVDSNCNNVIKPDSTCEFTITDLQFGEYEIKLVSPSGNERIVSVSITTTTTSSTSSSSSSSSSSMTVPCECSGGTCCTDDCYYDASGTTCGTCKNCDGAGSCVNLPAGSYYNTCNLCDGSGGLVPRPENVGEICAYYECGSNDEYLITGTQGASTTSQCVYREYPNAECVCQTDGSCNCDLSCPDYVDNVLLTCGPCEQVKTCTQSIQTCETYPDNYCCGSDQSCSSGSCVSDPGTMDLGLLSPGNSCDSVCGASDRSCVISNNWDCCYQSEICSTQTGSGCRELANSCSTVASGCFPVTGSECDWMEPLLYRHGYRPAKVDCVCSSC